MARPKTCRVCGRSGIMINRRRRCLSCSMNKCLASVKSLRAKKGKYYKKWRHNLLESLKKK